MGHTAKDKVEALIPEEKIRGAVEGLKVSLVSNLEAKSISGGDILVAEAVAQGSVPADRLTPTCLRLLKGLLRQRRDAEWICLFLAEDSALAATSNWLAMAEYHRGEVVLRGGHPTLAQLDSLKNAGLSARRLENGEGVILTDVFTAHSGLKGDRWKLSQSLRGATSAALNRESFFQLELDTRILSDVGKKHGRSGDQIRSLVLSVTRYYWLRAGEPWRP